ncbi:MAG: hypothetical protein Q7S40_09350 [Opitutaceae bacterium]|nr:hypothetical protein [Opitutaceae bacterium]
MDARAQCKRTGVTTFETASRDAFVRRCSWVRLRDNLTQREFVYANTHFDHPVTAVLMLDAPGS